MNGSAKRRTNPATSRHAPSAPELAWLYAVVGLGVAGSLVLVADLAVAPAAMPVLITATPAPGPDADTTPPAGGPVDPLLPPVVDQEPEPLEPAAAADTESEPPPVPAPTPEPPAADAIFRGQSRAIPSEAELRHQLCRAPEFGLKPAVRDALVESYKSYYQSTAATGRTPILDPSILLKRVPGARVLPLRGFPVCQLSADRAATLGVLSRALHAYLDGLAPKDATGKRGDPNRVREALRLERRGKPPEWLRPEALPAMVQILMAEDVPLRLILVDMMADIPGRAAGIRLAQRAVFDLSPEVRQAAIDALRQRPADEARRTLVEAMRYPWPAAADHAAEAIAALGDREAAPLLVDLLDKPDPAAPFPTRTGASVHEMVRVNHLQNCLLCHVPAVGRDAVTDVDPFANRPSQAYQVECYGISVPGGGGGVWSNRVLIRADVQFLRQDFSVTMPAGENYSSATGVRFDFLVRSRPLKPAEVREWHKQTQPASTSYPQREATLYALRSLTGQDAGATTEAWLKLYPHAHAEAEGQRIAAALRAAPPDQRQQLLARYRDANEPRSAEGLAHAIPHVSVKLREKVRAALVERLTRLPADEIRDYLTDADPELAHAARTALLHWSMRARRASGARAALN